MSNNEVSIPNKKSTKYWRNPFIVENDDSFKNTVDDSPTNEISRKNMEKLRKK